MSSWTSRHPAWTTPSPARGSRSSRRANCSPAFGVAAFDAPEASEQLAREAEQLLLKQSKIWLRRGRDAAEELEKFLAWRLERLIGMRPYVTVQISQI